LYDKSSQYKVTLFGTVKLPKISFHPPFLMLMPVPLDVETEGVFTIIPEDYVRPSQIRVELPELVLADGAKTCPFSVQFPEGQDIVLSSDGRNHGFICRVSFRSSEPMSYLGDIVFIDEE
ncbi:CFA47 protein, partial [Ptilonorhynchus violaceus]|nr:CFA47 protein [Ptilonorhynchus violaceus]